MADFQNTPLNIAAEAVTSSSGVVIASNVRRTYLLIQNDSNVDMYIRFGAAAGVNDGIRIGANGGSFESSLAYGNVDNRAVYAIHGDTGNKNMIITEGYN